VNYTSQTPFLAALKLVAITFLRPLSAVLFLRQQKNIVAICWILICLRCVFEIPAAIYNWENQSGELKFFWFLQMFYWLLSHPITMFIGVFIFTALYFLTTPFIWMSLFGKSLSEQQLYTAYATLFSAMLIVGPAIRLTDYTLSLWIEVVLVTLIMAVSVKISSGWSWGKALVASATVEALWLFGVGMASFVLIFLMGTSR
jgi:hypothetical protein